MINIDGDCEIIKRARNIKSNSQCIMNIDEVRTPTVINSQHKGLPTWCPCSVVRRMA